MNIGRYLKFGGIAIFAIYAMSYLIPVDRANPPVGREINWVSAESADLARRACYDCHSNETVWPWYSYVSPISFRIADHVEHGRRHLNFSEWDQPQDTHDLIEVIENGEMPLSDYLRQHPEADLTEAEKAILIAGIKETLAQDSPPEHDH
ncbi:MAG: heme-binding domain-containing protein [Anaerolineae bacterium]